MEGNVERFSGFADDYDAVRPSPPPVLKELILTLARMPRARLVVDLGSGTGLSTRFWADAAESVVGIEPNPDMRRQAEQAGRNGNVTYRDGLAHHTGIDGGAADVVTCSQSLHWMDPLPTFREVARILRPGGVFAAFDSDWPPTTAIWEADQAWERLTESVEPLQEVVDAGNKVRKWGKDGHLERMRKSGCFRYTKEMVLHNREEGTADRFVGLLLSQGGIQALLKAGRTERELGIDRFRATCAELLGTGPRQWYWSCRVRIGIR